MGRHKKIEPSEKAKTAHALALKNGQAHAARFLKISPQAISSLLKRWFPNSNVPKLHGQNGTPKEVKNRINKARRKRLSEKGICCRCLKIPASAGYKTCEMCREAMQNNSKLTKAGLPRKRAPGAGRPSLGKVKMTVHILPATRKALGEKPGEVLDAHFGGSNT